MSYSKLKTVTLFTLLLPLQTVLAGEQIDQTLDVDANGLISIDVFSGSISISAWDRDQFHIEGELSDSAIGYDLDESNGNIRFEEEVERSSFFNWRNYAGGSSGKLAIRIPKNSVLRFEGTNTHVDVTGLSGNTEIEVVNGGIVASDMSGVISLDTVNGSIDTNNLSGRIDLESVNGDIDDRNSSGGRLHIETTNGSIRSAGSVPRISAENVNGSILLEHEQVYDLEASTVNGSIKVYTSMLEQANIDLSSVGGRIELSLPASTSASFHAGTSVGGRIRNNLSDDEARKKNRYVNSRELDFVLNGGSGDVSITTVTGSISLEKR